MNIKSFREMEKIKLLLKRKAKTNFDSDDSSIMYIYF